jgi:hypothetical protein
MPVWWRDMGASINTKRKVIHHRRALQDQRFRAFLKRQLWRVKFEIWPAMKKGYRFCDAYLGDEISLAKCLLLTVLLFTALYLFGEVPV